MGHQPFILPVLEDKVGPVPGLAPSIVGEEDREASVDGMAPTMDDPNAREGGTDEPDPLEIKWSFVCDPKCFATDPPQ
jgi:hypothetical protein